MISAEEVRKQMNIAGSTGTPFFFILDFELKNGYFLPAPFQSNDLFFHFPNGSHPLYVEPKTQNLSFSINPIEKQLYKQGFDIVMEALMNGDSFLTNYCQRTPIEVGCGLDQIYARSDARYVTYVKDRFLSFSPETFVKTDPNGIISAYPIKGTVKARSFLDKYRLLNDSKERAEHYTLVDLIRNDLSQVATDVEVLKFREVEKVTTGTVPLYQTTSTISGRLPCDFQKHLGDIITSLLPAGSICGAPKKSTLEIIDSAERFPRGFYTGVSGFFDGKTLDSSVLIRFIVKDGQQLYYHSGGGITIHSDWEHEYQEIIDKIYLPCKG